MFKLPARGCLLLAVLCTVSPAIPLASAFDDIADKQPVVVSGAQVTAFSNVPVSMIWAYRYDPVTRTFLQAPVQVDQRALYTLSSGSINVDELTYDWLGIDDGLLDADDEIVFMASDAGPRAPSTDAWVPEAGDTRVEVAVTDPLSGAIEYMYLFASGDIEDENPSFSYVDYDAPDPSSGMAQVETSVYIVGYAGRWKLTRLEVKPNPDLLDRVKMRVYNLVGSETEDSFNETSAMFGAYAGKVRALREVKGGGLASLTTHIDTFYRDSWWRELRMRTHILSHVWYFTDYLAAATPGMYYSSIQTAGLPIDGVNEIPSNTTAARWFQVSLQRGTLVGYRRELTPFPTPDPRVGCAPLSGVTFYWRDDASYNDLTGDEPGAFGNHGLHAQCMDDTMVDSYNTLLVEHFLPLQSVFEPVGAAYDQRIENPLVATTAEQNRGALTDAALTAIGRLDGGRLLLSWSDALNEDNYEIHRGALTAPFLYAPQPIACNLPAQTTEWATSDDQVTGQPSYFYIVAPGQDDERLFGEDSDGEPRPPPGGECEDIGREARKPQVDEGSLFWNAPASLSEW